MPGRFIETEGFLKSGKWTEKDYLGQKVLNEKGIREQQEEGERQGRAVPYFPRREAMEFIKSHYYDKVPSEPEARWANDLHFAVFQKLESWGILENIEDFNFYNAIDTPLDIYHKIDAFFECRGHYATIDVKNRPEEGDETTKADFVVTEIRKKFPDFKEFEGAKEIYFKNLEVLSRGIAEKLREDLLEDRHKTKDQAKFK